MNKLLCCALAVWVLGVSFARAQDASAIKWKKIVLTDKFYGEGANLGDFNHDGKIDVVSGPYWYEGPDFSPEKKHEFMPAESYDPHKYSKN
ncbi:MAG TPA: hypothetical protein VLJ39_02600, partial [Tepidisphaeraceae bacterium]|nr:hypothetical protein [Tepidisphaeraceae bacterium]